MPAEEFVRRIGLASEQNDTHFVFWIGAGCSISSGIPGASTLTAERWLPQLRKIRGAEAQELNTWAESAFPGYDPDNPAVKYGEVMEDLFIQPESRQREIEALCDGRYPGFAYAVLAALLARSDGLFSVALTTNFDDLIADAMYVFTEARPLVIPDESLAGFIRPTRMRPLVVKVHGDHRLSPLNTQAETSDLKQGISEGIHNLLHDRGVIFVGYGGHDKGIAEVLESLPRQALPLGVWWVNPERPSGVLASWLEERDAIWVETRGFDELMLLFRDEFALDPPSPNKFERVFSGYLDTYKELSGRVGRIPDSDPEAVSLKGAAASADAAVSSWSALLLQAGRLEETNPDEAEKIYKKGMEDFPDVAALATGYAHLLSSLGKHQQALDTAEIALRIAPDQVILELVYGRMLAHLWRLKESKASIERVLEAEPKNVWARGFYGLLLSMMGDSASAELQLEQCLERQLSGRSEMSQMAILNDQLGHHESARYFHERTIAEIPESANAHSNFARCLIGLGLTDEAIAETDLAIELMPVKQLPLMLEVNYYRFVVCPPEEQAEMLGRIKDLLSMDGRSPFWSFEAVTKYGEANQHPDVEWLQPLAEVIGGKKEPELLSDWKAREAH